MGRLRGAVWVVVGSRMEELGERSLQVPGVPSAGAGARLMAFCERKHTLMFSESFLFKPAPVLMTEPVPAVLFC